MATLQQRLKAALRGGNLRVADLTRWFARPDPTVRSWVNGTVPSLPEQDMRDVLRRLAVLERHIKRGHHLPLTPGMPTIDRIERLKRLAASELR